MISAVIKVFGQKGMDQLISVCEDTMRAYYREGCGAPEASRPGLSDGGCLSVTENLSVDLFRPRSPDAIDRVDTRFNEQHRPHQPARKLPRLYQACRSKVAHSGDGKSAGITLSPDTSCRRAEATRSRRLPLLDARLRSLSRLSERGEPRHLGRREYCTASRITSLDTCRSSLRAVGFHYAPTLRAMASARKRVRSSASSPETPPTARATQSARRGRGLRGLRRKRCGQSRRMRLEPVLNTRDHLHEVAEVVEIAHGRTSFLHWNDESKKCHLPVPELYLYLPTHGGSVRAIREGE